MAMNRAFKVGASTTVAFVIALAGALGYALGQDEESEAHASQEPTHYGTDTVPQKGTYDFTEDENYQEPTEDEAFQDVFEFGQTYYGKRGNIIVSAAKAYEPDPELKYTEHRGQRYVVVTVTVENTSGSAAGMGDI